MRSVTQGDQARGILAGAKHAPFDCFLGAAAGMSHIDVSSEYLLLSGTMLAM